LVELALESLSEVPGSNHASGILSGGYNWAWSYQQKILRSVIFSEKVRKCYENRFCQKGWKNYLADVLAQLAY
jgi:hypothetical protein